MALNIIFKTSRWNKPGGDLSFNSVFPLKSVYCEALCNNILFTLAVSNISSHELFFTDGIFFLFFPTPCTFVLLLNSQGKELRKAYGNELKK